MVSAPGRGHRSANRLLAVSFHRVRLRGAEVDAAPVEAEGEEAEGGRNGNGPQKKA